MYFPERKKCLLLMHEHISTILVIYIAQELYQLPSFPKLKTNKQKERVGQNTPDQCCRRTTQNTLSASSLPGALLHLSASTWRFIKPTAILQLPACSYTETDDVSVHQKQSTLTGFLKNQDKKSFSLAPMQGRCLEFQPVRARWDFSILWGVSFNCLIYHKCGACSGKTRKNYGGLSWTQDMDIYPLNPWPQWFQYKTARPALKEGNKLALQLQIFCKFVISSQICAIHTLSF